jgi:hypothetical protein
MRHRRRLLLGHGTVAINSPSRILSALVTFLILLIAPFSAAQAGPKVVEESAQLLVDDGGVGFSGVSDVALDGNRLAVIGARRVQDLNLWIYERTANAENQWSAPLPVFQASGPELIGRSYVALQGNIAAVTFPGTLMVVERGTNGWSVTATLNTPPDVRDMGSDVEIDNGTIVVGGETGNYQALIYRKNASGVWSFISSLTGGPRHQNDSGDFHGGDVDISGNTVTIASPFFTLPVGPPSGSVFVFTNTGASWVQSAVLRYPLSDEEPAGWGTFAAVQADKLIVSHFEGDTYFYQRTNGVWSFASRYEPNVVFSGGQPSPAEISGNLIARSTADPVRGGGSVLVLSPQGSQLAPVALLQHAQLTHHDFRFIDLSGRTAVASSFGLVLVFDIPTDLSQPAIVQDNFQDGNANGWQPFTVNNWTVASSGTTRVYRQTTLASEARSVLGNSDWTQQSVTASIKPTAFDGTDRWFGLATRFTDPAHYYYVTVRSSNTILLRRMLNGVFTTLASGTLTVTPNQTYIVRLEAVGTRLRVYVNNQARLEAIDPSLSHGQAALLTFRTRADFDNVVVTPNALVTLFVDAFQSGPTTAWNKTGDGNWVDPPEDPGDPDFPDPFANQRNFSQTSTAGGARAHAGVATTADLSLQTRVRPNTLTPTGWFGVMARYTDDGNYYYVKVGAGGVASIRKLVNGAIFELANAPFPVSADTWYTVRLEVVGAQLRAYINDRFLMEATDTSLATGKYGLVTYRAAATFDDVDVREP